MTDALARTNGGGWLVAPSNMSEAFRFAETIAASDLAPKDFRNKPANVLVAIQLGAEVGLSPMQALQNIAVVNGRPSIWGDAQLALVRAHPSVLGYSEAFEPSTRTWTCTLRRQARDGSVETTVGTFSWADAQRAKLAGKQGPWSEYPDRMIKMRARSWCLRDGAADILKGLAQREEAADMAPVVVTEPAEHQRAAAATPALPPAAPSEPKAPPAPPSRPLPTKTTAKYPVKEWADKPFSELTHEALTSYVAYYAEKLTNGMLQANHRLAIQATIDAAHAEIEKRIAEEANSGAAQDPDDELLDEPPADFDAETGEVLDPPPATPDDEIAAKLQESLAILKSGMDPHDGSSGWGMDPVEKPKTTRTSRKGA